MLAMLTNLPREPLQKRVDFIFFPFILNCLLKALNVSSLAKKLMIVAGKR